MRTSKLRKGKIVAVRGASDRARLIGRHCGGWHVRYLETGGVQFVPDKDISIPISPSILAKLTEGRA